MSPQYYKDLIVRAVEDKNPETLDNLADHLRNAEKAHAILRAKGCGMQGSTIEATAALVPGKREW